ncbi:hypothetical protein Dimus_028077 [Dionaea muscipula]
MGTIEEDGKTSSNRRKWQKIFNALVKMLQSQQSQLETLVDDRNRLQNRIKVQYDRWVADVRLLEDENSQMKREISLIESERLVAASKTDFMLGLKHRAAFIYKHRLDDLEDELTDFKAWMDEKDKSIQMLLEAASKGNRQEDGSSKMTCAKKSEHHHPRLEKEVERLKTEYQELSTQKSAEISALLTEKSFVWNQYRIMESDLTNQLRIKNVEVSKLNEKVVILLENIEELQSANEEKDAKITALEANVAKLEADADKKSQEFSRILKEVEPLRRIKGAASITPPVVRTITTRSQSSRLDSSNGCSQINRPTWAKKGGSTPRETNDDPELKKIMKRKAVDSISKAETPPMLFTSSFKIPKLKSSQTPPVVTF